MERRIDDLVPISDLPEDLVEFNRARYKNELAQAVYELMLASKITRAKLAGLLGYDSRSRISHILSGEKNLQADTLADILLVMGRTPHIVMASDFDEIRFPVDECAGATESNVDMATSKEEESIDAITQYEIHQEEIHQEEIDYRSAWFIGQESPKGRTTRSGRVKGIAPYPAGPNYLLV